MKKLIALLLLWSAAAFGQTFPVNNLLVNGSATLATSTANALLLGQGSSPVSSLASGTSGFALLSNGIGVAPSFQQLTSGSLNFIQAGSGAVARIEQSKVREISVNVNDFGADPTGGTDSTTAIQNAINQVEALGGGYVDFGAGTYVISNTLNVFVTGTKLRGVGHDNNHDNGSPVVVTNLKWNGVSGGRMIVLGPPGGFQQRVSDQAVYGMFLDSNNGLAGVGIDAYSTNWGYYDVAGIGFSISFFRIGPSSALTGESADPQFNYINLDYRNLINGGAMLTLNGLSNSNASFNYFGRLHSVTLGTTQVMVLNNADNNIFENVAIFGTAPITGNSMILAAGATQNARANTFVHYSSNMPVYAEGTEVGATPSQNNKIVYWDVENAPVNITTGANATISVGSNHAPTGFRSYSANVGGTSSYIDEAGKVIASGFTGTVGTNSNTAITLPISFNTGAVSVQVTPNGGSPVRFSAQCSTTTLTIYNGADAATSFFWRVEGK